MFNSPKESLVLTRVCSSLHGFGSHVVGSLLVSSSSPVFVCTLKPIFQEVPSLRA